MKERDADAAIVLAAAIGVAVGFCALVGAPVLYILARYCK